LILFLRLFPSKFFNYFLFLLNESFPEAHNAEKDVTALANCVQVLLEKGIYRPELNLSTAKREIPAFEQTSLF
jgi:hypothetical protein